MVNLFYAITRKICRRTRWKISSKSRARLTALKIEFLFLSLDADGCVGNFVQLFQLTSYNTPGLHCVTGYVIFMICTLIDDDRPMPFNLNWQLASQLRFFIFRRKLSNAQKRNKHFQ